MTMAMTRRRKELSVGTRGSVKTFIFIEMFGFRIESFGFCTKKCSIFVLKMLDFAGQSRLLPKDDAVVNEQVRDLPTGERQQ